MFDFMTGRGHQRYEEQRQVSAALSAEIERTRSLTRDIGMQNAPLRTTDAQIMDYLRRTAKVADRARGNG